MCANNNRRHTLRLSFDDPFVKRLNLHLHLVEVEESVVHEKYEILHLLGEGASSQVFMAINRESNKHVAVKIIDCTTVVLNTRLLKEILILQRLDHPHIIKLEDVILTCDKLYIIMELASGRDLFEELVDRRTYTEKDAQNIVKKILSAVSYMHSQGIAHRDLKPDNIIYESHAKDADIKLVDFGLAEDIHEELMSTPDGTLGYKAPELLRGGAKYDQAVDMWALGVITYILLCGFPPFFSSRLDWTDADSMNNTPFWFFFNEDTEELRRTIESGAHSFPSPYWDGISKSARDFVSSLLQVDVLQRLTAEQALNHNWITLTSSDEDRNAVNLKVALSRMDYFNSVRQILNVHFKERPTLDQLVNSRILDASPCRVAPSIQRNRRDVKLLLFKRSSVEDLMERGIFQVVQ